MFDSIGAVSGSPFAVKQVDSSIAGVRTLRDRLVAIDDRTRAALGVLVMEQTNPELANSEYMGKIPKLRTAVEFVAEMYSEIREHPIRFQLGIGLD